jgi:SAM-dependent MidA family methyltransferase
VTLRERIEKEIREDGPIPFSRYMELCLYHPELGYYTRHTGQFGKAGDFYTSSDVHAVFGRLLARQFDEMWRFLESPPRIHVIELGAGRGLLAQDVLDWSEKNFPGFFRALHYELIEKSPALRQKLQQTLTRHLASGKCSLVSDFDRSAAKTANRPPGVGSPSIVFANEFFDALPVEVLGPEGSLRVDAHDGRFAETWAPSSPIELEFLDRYSIHPEPPDRVEALLVAHNQMTQIAESISHGFVIAIDYGYTRAELLEGRHRGTVMAYRQHSASPNPYEAPGEQDITAHVNFTVLAAAAEHAGMRIHKLLTQSQFLLGVGEKTQFADAFEECRLPQERAKVALQLKHLITPAGLGETFQVLVAHKGIDPQKASSLSGLSFGAA